MSSSTHLYLLCSNIKKEIIHRFGDNDFSFVPMTDAGSTRMFYRVSAFGENVAVLIVWESQDDDWDYFLELNKIDALHDIIPTIIEQRRKENWVMVRDCGETTLKSLMFDENCDEERQIFLFEQIAERLAEWQNVEVPQNNKIARRFFGFDDLMKETDYFRQHISAIIPETYKLFYNDEFDTERINLANRVNSMPLCLMHRDFQSENIVFSGDAVSFVDVQGARIGPCGYDAASLLFDPYLYPLVSRKLQTRFIMSLIRTHNGKLDALFLCALQRLMQAMGAYANLGINHKKERYLQYIHPAAIQALDIVDNELDRYPTLTRIFKLIIVKSEDSTLITTIK